MRVYGAEPANADDAARSFRSGQVEPLPAKMTIADGLRTTLSVRTLAAIRANVAAIGTASEDAIVQRDAHDLGADEDRDRAFVGGAAGVPARAHARRRGRAGRRHRLGRQRRPRPLCRGRTSLLPMTPRPAVNAAARRPRRDAAVQDAGPSRHRDLSRRFPGLPLRPLHPARAVGLRQVHAAEGGRRLHDPGRGRDPAEGRDRDAARSRPDDGVPGIRPAAAVEDGDRERDVPAGGERPARRRRRAGKGARRDRQGQPRRSSPTACRTRFRAA